MSDNEKDGEENEENKKKINYLQYGIKCLGIVVDLPIKRNKLFSYNTAYDSYVDFIFEAKKNIPIYSLRKAFPHQKNFATHEMILTPNFVCFLAMRRLRKMLDLEELPKLENIMDPPMKIKTKYDKALIKANPNNPNVFNPKSRDNIPSELIEFSHNVLSEFEKREKIKPL